MTIDGRRIGCLERPLGALQSYMSLPYPHSSQRQVYIQTIACLCTCSCFSHHFLEIFRHSAYPTWRGLQGIDVDETSGKMVDCWL